MFEWDIYSDGATLVSVCVCVCVNAHTNTLAADLKCYEQAHSALKRMYSR